MKKRFPPSQEENIKQTNKKKTSKSYYMQNSDLQLFHFSESQQLRIIIHNYKFLCAFYCYSIWQKFNLQYKEKDIPFSGNTEWPQVF